MTSQVSQYAQSVAEPGTVNFRLGQPAPGSLPTALLRRAAHHRFGRTDDESCDPYFLQYAVVQGYIDFRVALAVFLSERLAGAPVRPEELMAVAGASHGIDLCARLLARPGDVALVEEPTYFLCPGILRSAGLEVVGVPTDAEGLVVDDALEALVQARRPALLYTIPVHGNPTGVTLGPERRARLVALAQRYNFKIVADEVYQLLGFTVEDNALRPLRDYDEAGQGTAVVSLGSFSKTLAPGMRLGWVHAAPPILQRLAKDPVLVCGGGTVAMSAGLAHSVLELGLLGDRVLSVRAELAEKCAALCAALDEHVCYAGAPGRAAYHRPHGGYFVWLQLPGVDTAALLPRAKEKGVSYMPGAMTVADPAGAVPPALRNAIRLAFSFYTPAELREGVRRLAEVIHAEWTAPAAPVAP